MAIIAPIPVANLPTPPDPSQAEAEFDTAAFTWSSDLNRWTEGANDLAGNVYNNATEAKAAADTATTKAAEAASSATSASGNANTATNKASEALSSANSAASSASTATTKANEAASSAASAQSSAQAAAASAASISGGPVTSVNGQTGVVTLTAYDVGSVPTTRKINGQALTADVTIAAGIGAVATPSSATDITLTAASAGYQSVSMTAMGKSVILPDATTMDVGGPRFILKNDGGYPFGIRDAVGGLVIAVAAGGIAYVTLVSKATAAGQWSVIGDNLEPGLITIDNTFSSTYASTVLNPFVALDANKSIHFLKDTSNGLYAVAVDNSTGAVGTPVLIKTATASLRTAFKVSASTAIVFYDDDGTNYYAVVLTVSGATSISLGAAATTSGVSNTWGGENFYGAPKLVQLSANLYLVSGTDGANTHVRAVSVSGTTVTIGSAANIITANSVADSTTTYRLTDTTALVLYKSGASAPYTNNAVVISVSGTTCAVGTPANTTLTSQYASPSNSCLLSTTKAILADDGNATNTAKAVAVTVSGTTVSAGSVITVETATNISGSIGQYAGNEGATRYNPHLFPLDSSRALLWYVDGYNDSRAVVLSESGGTVTKGAILYGSFSKGLGSNTPGAVFPQGVTEFSTLRYSAWNTSLYIAGRLHVTAHKISGNSITTGTSQTLDKAEITQQGTRNTAAFAMRFASGRIAVGTSYGQGRGLDVFSSNGDAIAMLGRINTPNLDGFFGGQVVSSNRAVLLAGTTDSVSLSSFQLRLLNVEIAQ